MVIKKHYKILLLMLITLMLAYFAVNMSITSLRQVIVNHPSEIRGVFVKWLDSGVTWESLASSYESYGVNWLVGESCGTYFSRSNLVSLGISSNTYDYIGEGIKAAHNHGMKFTAMMLIGFRGPETSLDPNICAVDQYGNLVRWASPVKAHDLIVSIATEIATKYPDLDGFMFDYIRYSTDYDMFIDFSEASHQKFVADTGLTDVSWPTDVLDGGRYYSNFMEWRVKPITDIVRDVHDAMIAINPKLEFSIAALSLWYISGVGYGHPIRQWYGQDTADMVAKGYIDVVCPMQYTTDQTLLAGVISTCSKYMIGGAEGKVPLVPIIGGMEGSGSDMTSSQLKSCVDTCRNAGADGFLIYRQVPGFASTYLAPLTNNPVFSVSGLSATKNVGSVTFTWQTSQATSSTVEYSESPLFYSQQLSYNGFIYYQVTHSSSTTLKEDTAQVTSHSITIPSDGTSQIHFRIQSKGSFNTLSSSELVYNPVGETIVSDDEGSGDNSSLGDNSTSTTSPTPTSSPVIPNPFEGFSFEDNDFLIQSSVISAFAVLSIYVLYKNRRKRRR